MEKEINLDAFVKAMDELKKSKYILVDKRIGELLRVIGRNKELMNYITECSINFDFVRTFKTCEENGKFVLPEKDFLLVAFIYELLKRFDCKKINITEFITKNFEHNFENIDSYQFFSLAVLNRFEAVICKKFYGVSYEEKFIKKDNDELFGADIVKRLVFLLHSITEGNMQNKIYTKNETRSYINAIIFLLNKKEFVEIKSLVMMLNKFKFKSKLDRQLIKEISALVK